MFFSLWCFIFWLGFLMFVLLVFLVGFCLSLALVIVFIKCMRLMLDRKKLSGEPKLGCTPYTFFRIFFVRKKGVYPMVFHPKSRKKVVFPFSTLKPVRKE